MNTNLQKYLKYKLKYLDLKNELQLQVGGSYPYPSLYGGSYTKEHLIEIRRMYDEGCIPGDIYLNTVSQPSGTVVPINSMDEMIAIIAGNDATFNDGSKTKLTITPAILDEIVKDSIITHDNLRILYNDGALIGTDIETLIKNDKGDLLKAQQDLAQANIELAQAKSDLAAAMLSIKTSSPALAGITKERDDLINVRDQLIQDLATARAAAGGVHHVTTTTTGTTPIGLHKSSADIFAKIKQYIILLKMNRPPSIVFGAVKALVEDCTKHHNLTKSNIGDFTDDLKSYTTDLLTNANLSSLIAQKTKELDTIMISLDSLVPT